MERSDKPRGVASISKSRVNLIALVAISALFFFSIILRIISFKILIFDWDEYAFGLSGVSVTHGFLPGSEIFDNKPAGLVYIFALFQMLFGENTAALRAIGLIAVIATCWLSYRAAMEVGLQRSTALVTVTLFSFLTLRSGGWASMSELVACPFLAWANYIIIKDNWNNSKTFFIFGVIFGIAFQISYLTAPIGAVTTVIMLMRTSKNDRWQALRHGSIALLGFGAAIITIWLPHLMQGNFVNYVRDQVAFYKTYRDSVTNYWTMFKFYYIFLIYFIIIYFIFRDTSDRRKKIIKNPAFYIIAYGLLAAIFAACSSSKFYTHYFILTLPMLPPIISIVFAGINSTRAKLLFIILSCYGIFLCISESLYLRSRLNESTVATSSEPAVLAGFGGSNFEFMAAQLINKASNPADKILIFDESHVIYYLSKRNPCIKYIFISHYIQDSPSILGMISTKLYLLKAISSRPMLIVIGHLRPIDFNAEALVTAAGYRPIARLQLGKRMLMIYKRIASQKSVALNRLT